MDWLGFGAGKPDDNKNKLEEGVDIRIILKHFTHIIRFSFMKGGSCKQENYLYGITPLKRIRKIYIIDIKKAFDFIDRIIHKKILLAFINI